MDHYPVLAGHTRTLLAGVYRCRADTADRFSDLGDSLLSGCRIRAFLKHVVPVQPVAGMICRRTTFVDTRMAGGLRKGRNKYKKKKQGLSPESRQEFFHNERGEWSTNFLPVFQ